MSEKEIIDALRKIPKIVNAAETFQTNSYAILGKLAQLIQQYHPEVIIPEKTFSELERKIINTPCAAPKADVFSEQLMRNLVPGIRSIIKDSIREERQEHFKPLFRKIRFYRAFVIILIGILSISTHKYYTSDEFRGVQYNKICNSEYITPAEKRELVNDCSTISTLPISYDNNPKLVVSRINKNKRILRRRERHEKKYGEWEPVESIKPTD